MRLTIFGSGYVGLVQGACMAETGNHVVCYDIDEDKIAALNRGEITIYEPGLEEYVERNVEAGRLEFTTDVKKAVDHGLFQFIAVGTPPDEDGSADLSHVLAVAASIGELLEGPLLVVVRAEGRDVTGQELLDYYEGKVAKWWIPTDVEFVDELPHTATGKVKKIELRKQFADYALPS